MARDTLSVRISGDGLGHKIAINGHPVERWVTGASLEIDPREGCPVLTLRMIVDGPRSVDTHARVVLDAEAEEALKAMGWTPPAEGGADDGV